MKIHFSVSISFSLIKLFAVTVMAMMPITILAFHAKVDGIYYEFLGSEATVTCQTWQYNNISEYSGDVVIPEYVTYNNIIYEVTSIGNNAFYNSGDLTSVTIPNSVTSIGSDAFYGCSSLTSIVIPNSVTRIGEEAFYRCSGLTFVSIGNSVTSIGQIVFGGCTNLTTVTLESNSIVSANRSHDTSMKSIFGDKVKTYIIGNDVTRIGDYAFSGCSGLVSVTIGNGVTSIGGAAFGGCSSLTSITIPNSVTRIGYYAFENCSGLQKVIVSDIAAWCRILFGDYNANPLYYTHHLYSDEETEITDLVIPNSVTSVNDYAFYGCSGLTSVTIPNSVTSIGYMAFYGCSGLTSSVTIPNSVTSIGQDAFYGCSGLITATIGSGVLSIGSSAFQSTSLKKVIWLPNTPPSGYGNASGAINYVSNEQYTNLKNKVVYPFLSSMFEVDGIKYVPVNPSERTCDAIDCLYDESVANTSIGPIVSYKGITMNVQKIQPYLCYNMSFPRKS